ncbi:phenylalanine--tRNA ligase subunit beta [Candidatus Bathyarchaeota archaeon]|nr:MAG: phenylalanine--tRNA ligase subunit beta [Candidatus Bathyarchaeota archaeon]
MPVIEVLFNDLQRLVKADLPRNLAELTDILSYVKGEAVSLEEDALSIEIKDGNRPDLWCVEGIARELKGALGVEEGLREYVVKGFSGISMEVDPRLENIRPFIGCAVVKEVHLTSEVIRELMHLQDKLDQTYGRRRRRASIGLYNLGLITPPLQFDVAKPEDVSFVPLGGEVEMTLREIVESHPKGIEYGHLVKKHERWPILRDSKEKVLSIPPIINSNNLGKISEGEEDIFVEVTGTDYRTVLNTLKIVTLSLADRGEEIFSTQVRYPYGEERVVSTPNLSVKEVRLDLNYVNQILGLSLKVDMVLKLLKRARYNVKWSGGSSIEVTVPCYRMDVMHQLDIIEDVAIMYGYNNLKPRWPQQITFGKISDFEAFSDATREVMTGLGFQETLSFSLSNDEQLFRKMNLKGEKAVELLNPTSLRFTCLQSWLIPSLMDFLSKNTHVEYPQRIFEVGDCVVPDEASETGVQNIRKLACLITHSNSNFSEIKASLNAFSINMGFKHQLFESTHKSFIEGRVGTIFVQKKQVGIIGEINPLILEMWGLENPVTGFEVNLSTLMNAT